MSGSDSPTFFHGQPWSSWIEKIGRDKPLSDDEPDNEPTSSVMRLSSEDIDLYGFCPERDTFYGVVCEMCNSVVKPQALIQHMESRHPTGSVTLPPVMNNSTSNSTKQAIKTPYCKVSKLKKSQSMGQIAINSSNGNTNGNSSNGSGINNGKTCNNHTPIKQRIAEQQPNSHPGLSNSSPRSPLENSNSMPCVQTTSSFTNHAGNASGSPVKSPGNQPKRKKLKTERSLLKDREYDPNRHCGVWNEETGKPCTRSLTCKAHTVSLRRTVIGRSKTFDKLLAEHRASKEAPNARTQAAKATSVNSIAVPIAAAAAVAVTSNNANIAGTISISTAEATTANALTPSTPAATMTSSQAELEAPSSPPVLSLPDTYPLPQAVDLLYRCLAPHGSNKPTKLEEDFASELDTNRRIEPTVVNNSSNTIANVASASSSITTTSNTSIMTTVSVVLPSLSPIQTNSISPQAPILQYNQNFNASSPIGLNQIINKQPAISAPAAPVVLPVSNQAAPSTSVALEAKTAPMDIDNSKTMTMYPSSMFKDSGKSQVTVQISRANIVTQTPLSRNYSKLFDSTLDHLSVDHSRLTNHVMANGKRLNNHLPNHQNQVTRTKQEFPHEYSAAIQLEATVPSTPYTTFNDISWSTCHPEPLAVNRWLRISSTRKQYNFNIH